MNPTRKIWLVLAGVILVMAVIACSCGSLSPSPTSKPTPSQPPLPITTQPPLPAITQAASGNSLPYYDDFSDSNSGWEIFDHTEDSVGYENGIYFVISRTTDFSSYGAAGKLYEDTVIDVDATPVNGPSADKYSYNVGCRGQSNGDGYVFEVEGDGYYAVGYYTGSGKDYSSLLSGPDEWQFSDAIHPGLVTNHFTVTCSGGQLKLELNGQMVFAGQDATFSEGDISLGAATYDDNKTPVEVHFDNLAVTAP